jgi:predicted RNase H-like HicB family nuclease
MSAKKLTITVEYIGKGLYSATCAEFPDCCAVTDSEESARRSVEEAVEKRLLDRNAHEEDRSS